MTLPLGGSVLYFVLLSEHPAGQLIYGGVKLFTIVWPIICVLVLWRRGVGNWRGKLGNIRTHLKALPLGVAVGLLIVAAMVGLLQTPLGAIVDASEPAMRKKATALGFLENYILFAAFLSVIHSLIEEYYWRWFVFGNLRRLLSVRTAAGVGSVAFASHHVVVTAQFFPLGFALFLSACVAIGGLLWCWLYHTQRTLAGAWVSHLIADVGLMTVGYLLLH